MCVAIQGHDAGSNGWRSPRVQPRAGRGRRVGGGGSGGGGGGSSGGGRSPPAWLGGYCKWLLLQAAGVLLALPAALLLAANLLFRPHKVLYWKDRSQPLPDPLPGLTHEWIETEPGIRLHAVRTSMGSGRTLMLLVHGFPEAWFSWKNQMQEFRQQYEVVAIDMRGFGESSRPQGRAAYRLEAVQGDLVAVIQHLLQDSGQKQLVLAGHDWGANACWAAAHAAPHLLSRLIILSTPHPLLFFKNMDWQQMARSWYILVFQLPWLPEAAFCAGDYALLAATYTHRTGSKMQSVFSEQDLERYKQAFGRPGAATAALHYYRALVDLKTRHPNPAFEQVLSRRMAVSTLLLWADGDVAFGPQLLRDTEQYATSLKVRVVEDCSHWAQQHQPEQVNRLMREFLGGSGGSSSSSSGSGGSSSEGSGGSSNVGHGRRSARSGR